MLWRLGWVAFALSACSSDRDPYLDEVRAELGTSTFRCGEERCVLHSEYCVVSAADPSADAGAESASVSYSCAPIPLACEGSAVCKCLGARECYEQKGRVIVDAW